MKLAFFSRPFVKRLRESASSNASRYATDQGWLRQFAGNSPVIHDSSIVVDPAPQLLFEEKDNPKFDAENAIRVYSWLEGISPVVAMEERLWAYLAHWTFAEYMAARWPVEGPSTVLRRYLYEGHSAAALARQGISRLWWAAHLTKDPGRSDPFELTRVLFLRQDIQVALLERSLGKSPPVRTGVLDFLKDNHSWISTGNFTKRIQKLAVELNMLGGVALLEAISKEHLNEFLQSASRRVIDSLDKEH